MKNTLFSRVATATLLAAFTFSACQKETINQDYPSVQASSRTADANARASATTGQGIMIDFDVANYVLTEEVTYKFDKDAAKNSYAVTSITGPVITRGSGATQATPSQPAADPIGTNVVEQNKCTFFSGGDLPDYSYTKTINGTRGWKWVWTYNVTGQVVAAETAWNKTVTGGATSVDAPINVRIAGLSAVSSKQHPLKYSFSLLADDGLTNRVQNLKLMVDGVEVASPNSNIVNGENFLYVTNAGTNGNTSLLSGSNGSTTYINGTDNQWASTILQSDSFDGNNGAASITSAKMDQVVANLTAGTHTITLTGIVKGNSASADAPINVTKQVTISGGCNN